MQRSMPDINYFIAVGIGLITMFAIMLVAQACWAVEIDMDIIAQIESSNNSLAYNSRTKATGLYQITPICLADYNQYHKIKYTMSDMFNSNKCYIVANWYMNNVLTKYLKYYKIPVTQKNYLISYHDGIGSLIKYLNGKRKLGKEMKGYLLKYEKLNKRKKM